MEKGDPRIEFYAAVYRHALNGYAGPDWGLDETVTRTQALAMFTCTAAFAVDRDHELGTLEVGKRADLTAYSKDLMTVEPAEIPKAEATLTISSGRLTHQRDRA